MARWLKPLPLIIVAISLRSLLSPRDLAAGSLLGAGLRAHPGLLDRNLLVPQDRRGTTFFELDWRKCGRQFAYQDQLSAVMGDADESQLFECDFVPSPRKDGRAHADGDVFVAGIHVGELGNYGGQGTGFARFHKWPDNIEMKVLVPLADSTWPRSTQPFMWKGGSTT